MFLSCEITLAEPTTMTVVQVALSFMERALTARTVTRAVEDMDGPVIERKPDAIEHDLKQISRLSLSRLQTRGAR